MNIKCPNFLGGDTPEPLLREGRPPPVQGVRGVTHDKLLKCYIQNCAFWCICSGFEQLLYMLSRVLQKSLRWSSSAAFLRPPAVTRRPSGAGALIAMLCLPYFTPCKMFLVMFWSETAFYSRRTSTVVACTFAAVCLADHNRDGNICRFNDCFGIFYIFNQGSSQSHFLSLFTSRLIQSLHLRDVICQHLPAISERAMEH